MKSNIESSRAVLVLHLVALCKIGILASSMSTLLPLSPEMGSSLLTQVLIFGSGGALLAETAVFGLKRKKEWGYLLAWGVGFLNIGSLLFPLSLALFWFLIPQAYREKASQAAKEAIKSDAT